MRAIRSILPAIFILTGIAAAQPAFKPSDVTGSWRFAKPPRKFPVSAVLRQEGSRYPGFFAGDIGGGPFSIRAEADLLGDSFTLRSEGGFDCVLTRSALKQGMEGRIPGGVWMHNLSEAAPRIRLTGFVDWRVAADAGKKGKGTRLRADAAGEIEAGGRKAPLVGTADFVFADGLAKFDLSTDLRFEGEALGWDGEFAGPIRIELTTQSPLSHAEPSLPDVDSFEFK